MGKFDDFIHLVNVFHIQKCGKSNCGTCNFIYNLLYGKCVVWDILCGKFVKLLSTKL